MKNIVFALPGNELLAKSIAEKSRSETGEAIIKHFPDRETYVKINSDVRGHKVVLVCTLNHPDDKLLPLYFLAKTARDLGAKHICLVSPYLAYMRQDRRFKKGEGITSEYFAKLISFFIDELVTVEPHLHRRASLSEIYSVPARVLHASGLIADWIKKNVEKPLLIGPDSESEQWVSEVAGKAGISYIVLEKKRKGDREVKISVPHLGKFREHTPVLIDDIISTARTMIETIRHLKNSGMKPPACIAIHGIFADHAYDDLLKVGADRIVTCNTVLHESNGIDVSKMVAEAIRV